MSLKRVALGVGIGAAVAAYRAIKQLDKVDHEREEETAQSDTERTQIQTEHMEVDGDESEASARITFANDEESESIDEEPTVDTDSQDVVVGEEEELDEMLGSIVDDAIGLGLVNEVVDAVDEGTIKSPYDFDGVEMFDEGDTGENGYVPLLQLTTPSTRVIMEYISGDDVDTDYIETFASYRPTGYRRVLLVSEENVEKVEEIVSDEIDANVVVAASSDVTEHV